jgi:hypothetical protein
MPWEVSDKCATSLIQNLDTHNSYKSITIAVKSHETVKIFFIATNHMRQSKIVDSQKCSVKEISRTNYPVFTTSTCFIRPNLSPALLPSFSSSTIPPIYSNLTEGSEL